MTLHREGNRLVSDLPDLGYDQKYVITLTPEASIVGRFRGFRNYEDGSGDQANFLIYTHAGGVTRTGYVTVHISCVGGRVP